MNESEVRDVFSAPKKGDKIRCTVEGKNATCVVRACAFGGVAYTILHAVHPLKKFMSREAWEALRETHEAVREETPNV